MHKKAIGLVVVGLVLLPLAAFAASCPRIVYNSQSSGSVTADYFGMPGGSQVILTNTSTGATTSPLATISGTSTVSVSTISVPSGGYVLRAVSGTTTLAQTVTFYVSNLVRRVGQAN